MRRELDASADFDLSSFVNQYWFHIEAVPPKEHPCSAGQVLLPEHNKITEGGGCAFASNDTNLRCHWSLSSALTQATIRFYLRETQVLIHCEVKHRNRTGRHDGGSKRIAAFKDLTGQEQLRMATQEPIPSTPVQSIR